MKCTILIEATPDGDAPITREIGTILGQWQIFALKRWG